MVKKIIRDLTTSGSKTISLKEDAVSVKSSSLEDVIDCSVIGKKKKIITGTVRKSIRDISAKNDSEEKTKVFYISVDEADNIKFNKVGDLIRLASAGLVILLVLNIINIYNRGITLKNDVVATAFSGYQDLLSASEAASKAEFLSAEQTFSQAEARFDKALADISFLKNNQNYFLTKDATSDSVQGLLNAAKNISLAGSNFSKGIESLQYLPSLFILENSRQIASVDSSSTNKESLTDKLKGDLAYIRTATEQVHQAGENLEKVSPNVLPPGFRDKLEVIKSQTNAISGLLSETQKKIPAMLNLLGDRYPHRYLVLLQNDSEARPTGGFIGSYLIVDLNDGYITKFEFHDVYEIDGQFHEFIEPPEDISLVSDTWRLRDSNYSPDFRISAEKAAWFLQKENGPSVDSVIAVNLSFIEVLLALTGPITISDLDEPLDQSNFQLILSYIIESKLNGAEKPKEIMKELIPAFQQKLAGEVELDKLINALLRGVKHKKIMMYSRHQEVQDIFDEFNLSNPVSNTAEKSDYLQVTATSIGGNKSDRFINENINHYTLVQPDGTVMDEVMISRQHSWNGKDLERWQNILGAFGFRDLPPHIIDILGRGKNVTFIKVYVPEGSRITGVSGIKEDEVYTRVDKDLNKTYFMFKMEVSPLETEKVSITYELPYKLEMYPADTYRFTAQNQPSYKPAYLEKKIYFKPGYKSYKHYPDTFKQSDDGSLIYGATFSEDVYLSALVGN